MPSTQQPNCQRSNQAEPAETGLSPACYSGEITRVSRAISRKQQPTSSTQSLGVEQSGKGRIYSCSPTPSTPPTKNSLLFLTDWNLAFAHWLGLLGKPTASNAESSDSFVGFQYRNFEIAGKGSISFFRDQNSSQRERGWR
jgi:hypothetical protein